jgi:glycosyltransferase involved in cell wall biosynthesis
MLALLLLSVAVCAEPLLPPPRLLVRGAGAPLRIALRSQSGDFGDSGYVAGSYFTTNGLASAFRAQGHDARVVWPGQLDRLVPPRLRDAPVLEVRELSMSSRHAPVGSAREWVPDLVIVEGVTGDLVPLLVQIRVIWPDTVIAYWCLDLYAHVESMAEYILNLPYVDMFFTNSRSVEGMLRSKDRAVSFVPLAFNEATFYPSSQTLPPCSPDWFEGDLEKPLGCNLGDWAIYVGQWTEGKQQLGAFLSAVASSGVRLAIFGVGWDHAPRELAPFCHGTLPSKRLPDIYRQAGVVLAMTDDGQRRLGMVNNRVFEALACGAVVVSDSFPELQELFPREISNGVLRTYSLDHPSFRGHVQSVVQEAIAQSERLEWDAFVRDHSYHERASVMLQALRAPTRVFHTPRAMLVCALHLRVPGLPLEAFEQGYIDALRRLSAREDLASRTPGCASSESQEALDVFGETCGEEWSPGWLLYRRQLFSIASISLAQLASNVSEWEAFASQYLQSSQTGALPSLPVAGDRFASLRELAPRCDTTIVKSNWGWYGDTVFRAAFESSGPIVRLPSVLLVSGTAPPPPLREMLRYSCLVAETELYAKLLRTMGHPCVLVAFGVSGEALERGRDRVLRAGTWQRAFETDVLLQRYVHQGKHAFDVLMIASASSASREKRFERFMERCLEARRLNPSARCGAIGLQTAFEGNEQALFWRKQCQRHQIDAVPVLDSERLGSVLAASKTLAVPSSMHGGGERAVLEGLIAGVSAVEVETDNPKLAELLSRSAGQRSTAYALDIARAIAAANSYGHYASTLLSESLRLELFQLVSGAAPESEQLLPWNWFSRAALPLLDDGLEALPTAKTLYASAPVLVVTGPTLALFLGDGDGLRGALGTCCVTLNAAESSCSGDSRHRIIVDARSAFLEAPASVQLVTTVMRIVAIDRMATNHKPARTRPVRLVFLRSSGGALQMVERAKEVAQQLHPSQVFVVRDAQSQASDWTPSWVPPEWNENTRLLGLPLSWESARASTWNTIPDLRGKLGAPIASLV